MRKRVWATLAITAVGVALANAAPVAASENAKGDTIPWSVAFETASASGDRWLTPVSTSSEHLVVSGTLSNTGSECYSVWTSIWRDFAGLSTKRAEICGPGTVAVDFENSYNYMTNGTIYICKGTVYTDECGPRVDITYW